MSHRLDIYAETDETDAAIVGSIEALLELRNMINDALGFGLSTTGDYVNRTGEHYVLIVTPAKKSKE